MKIYWFAEKFNIFTCIRKLHFISIEMIKCNFALHFNKDIIIKYFWGVFYVFCIFNFDCIPMKCVELKKMFSYIKFHVWHFMLKWFNFITFFHYKIFLCVKKWKKSIFFSYYQGPITMRCQLTIVECNVYPGALK